MFGTIRKHQTWLWVVIIGVMIFGLIQWQNSLGKSGNGPRGVGDLGAIDGRPITETEMRHARVDADLSYFLQTGEWPEIGKPRQGWNQTVEDYKQVFYVRKLDQYNIHTDPSVVARFAGLVIQKISNGESLSPEMFVDRVLKPRGITAEDFQRFLEHYLSIQQLESVVGNSGKFTTAGEIQSLYVQAHQERAVSVVFFSASNYLANIPAQPVVAALQQYYERNTNTYAVPDQMQLSYVFFNITNFLPQAEKDLGTNLSADVEAAYRRAGTNALSYGKTPDEAKAKIREYFIRSVAITNAQAKALAFQSEVASKEPTSAANLSIVAKAKDLEVKVTQPFDKDYGPSDIHLASGFPVASLFNLSTDDPFPELPVRGPDGVYVVAFDKLIPAHIPSLDEIHSRVVADYREAMARSFAQASASTFLQTVTNGLAKGKTFAAVTADAKLKAVELPPFSEITESLPGVEDHVDLNTFKQYAFHTPVGEAEFIPTRSGAIVLHVGEQLPVDPVKMQADLPAFSKAVRQQKVNEAFESWFGREANAALGKIRQVQDALRQERS
jgi:hypothetical protein